MSKNGFSLIELVIVMAISLTATLMFSGQIAEIYKYTGNIQGKYTLLVLRDDISMAIASDTAWVSTVQDAANTAMACRRNQTDCCLPVGDPTCTPASGVIQLSNQVHLAQPLVYNTTTNTTQGFTKDGYACDTYGTTPCPFQVTVTWKAVCPGGGGQPCLDPSDHVTITFANYDSGDKAFEFIGERYNFVRTRDEPDSGELGAPFGACHGDPVAAFAPLETNNGDGTETIDLSLYPTARCVKVYCGLQSDPSSAAQDATISFSPLGTFPNYIVCAGTMNTKPNRLVTKQEQIIIIPEGATEVNIDWNIGAYAGRIVTDLLE